jgi:hypothetical protein
MKDAKGHGSNSRGGSTFVTPAGRGVMPSRPFRESGGEPEANNAQAAGALFYGGPKSQAAPIHDGMHNPNTNYYGVGPNSPLAGSRDYDAFGRPRSDESKSEYDAYSRDLGYRARNGGIGSGRMTGERSTSPGD